MLLVYLKPETHMLHFLHSGCGIQSHVLTPDYFTNDMSEAVKESDRLTMQFDIEYFPDFNVLPTNVCPALVPVTQ